MLGVVENMNLNKIRGGTRVSHLSSRTHSLRRASSQGHAPATREDSIPPLHKLKAGEQHRGVNRSLDLGPRADEKFTRYKKRRKIDQRPKPIKFLGENFCDPELSKKNLLDVT